MSDLITAEEACDRLGIRPQTLYAYVSRGLLDAVADPADSRRSLYRRTDVDGMAARKVAGRSRPAVAARAIDWGDPVLETSISTVRRGRLIYRGEDAADWSENATLEETAALLSGVEDWPDEEPPRMPTGESSGIAGAVGLLARALAGAPPMFGRSRQAIAAEGAALLKGLAGVLLGGHAGGPAHEMAAASWDLSPAGGDLVRRAMVLLADHELNASTFAVRIVASTGATLPAALAAGLAALSGPIHGGATPRAIAMFEAAMEAEDAAAFFAARLARGERLEGLSHPLYPEGDMRAQALIGRMDLDDRLRDVIDAAETVWAMRLNVDGALAALAHTLRLSPEQAFAIFALGRSAGWIAHAIEQVETGVLIRPRARYRGPLSAE
ncbi:MAG: citrate synthase [Alphaproteobacteria bacterium]|nr:citrate synthase [Alphaproteobacteria bacterium]